MAEPHPRKQILVPWVEKFRPKSLKEVVSQDMLVKSMTNFLSVGNVWLIHQPRCLIHLFPHFSASSFVILWTPGYREDVRDSCPRSRSLWVFASSFNPFQIFSSPEMFKQRVMELNASDERGINTIREKVKRFAQQAIAGKPTGYPYPCPPFKIIILDEADSLTTDAQTALRRVIEVHTKVTRFCLVCNYVSKFLVASPYLGPLYSVLCFQDYRSADVALCQISVLSPPLGRRHRAPEVHMHHRRRHLW
jgi:replication factor C subunit 2/4